ncbi:MAG: hypothetical protein HYX73_06245 [Acidobacteria bacterium]|nr:hypothetical protein [Acidobacteriota bacterium]
MPRVQQHLQKAEHNEAFVASLDWKTTPFLDWVVTGLFYAALQYVEAYLATREIHSVDHRARDSDIRRDHYLKPVYRAYSELKNHSINARYMTTRFGVDDVEALRPELASIRTLVLRLIRQ